MHRSNRMPEHAFIEEYEGIQRLGLRGGSDCLDDGQMVEKRFDFGRAEFARMALAVEVDELLDPVAVADFGSRTEVPSATGRGELVKKPRWIAERLTP